MTMQRRRLHQSQHVHNRTTPMGDLFDPPPRQPPIPAPQPLDDELWSVRVVRMKTGLSRATVYKYMALGLFPRQRHLGPGRIAWRASEIRAWIASR
jgi:predicted DNA-binding transcriptional regulator AlpA